MKRFLLVTMALLSFVGFTVKAQSFEFQYQGKSLEDGATVTIAAEENAFGQLSCETNPSANPNNGLVLRVPDDYDKNARARLEILHNTLNASVIQWCMGGECTIFGVKPFLSKTFEATGYDQVLFDASSISDTGYLMAELSVTLQSNTIRVYIQFTNGDSAGINGIQYASEPRNVYSLSGQIVSSGIAGMKPLPAGVYIVGGKKYIIN